MLKFFLFWSLVLSLFLANAEYFSPKNHKKNILFNIDSIIKRPKDKGEVVLKGKIIKRVFRDKFLFSDGKDSILVNIPERKFPDGKVDENTYLAIIGEVSSKDGSSPEVDVMVMRIVDQKGQVFKHSKSFRTQGYTVEQDFASDLINRESKF